MSGQIIPTPAYKAEDWQNFGNQVEKQRLGFIGLVLTNFDNNNEPQIAAGSVVEISGSLFSFPSNDSIGGTPTSGLINFIMLEVSGSGDSQTVSGSWTTTAPTWNDAKNGYYDATGMKRYIGRCDYDGTNYKNKLVYNPHRVAYDAYGAEVKGVQYETKIWTGSSSCASGSTIVLTASGFSWDPDGVVAMQVSYGTAASAVQFFWGFPASTGQINAALYVGATNLVLGTNQVQVTLYQQTGNTQYFQMFACTAVKN